AVYLIGSLPHLGAWSFAAAVPLNASAYTPDDPLWTARVRLPAATAFQYKYIKRTLDGRLVWLPGPNLRATSSAGCGHGTTLSDVWP
ncbi:hypothetical protein E4U42_000624, partial [Claviceps africana]